MVLSFTRSQVSPLSSDRSSTPSSASTMAHTRPDCAGEIATPMRPLMPSGMPERSVRSVQVSPPSVDRHSPDSGPALVRPQGVLRTCHMAAKSTRGLCGSIDRSIAPESSLLNRICSQFCPPSLDRNTPRSLLGPKACPRAATYTRSGSFGWTRTLEM